MKTAAKVIKIFKNGQGDIRRDNIANKIYRAFILPKNSAADPA
jgi:hypothetical protein